MIDLHNHSKFSSDARGEPEEFVREAKRKGLSAISMTEHERVDSTRRAQAEAEKIGIKYIIGMEFTGWYNYNGNIFAADILGYNFDPESTHIHELIEACYERFNGEDDYFLEGLREMGIDVTKNKVISTAENHGWFVHPYLSRNIYRYLEVNGHVDNTDEAKDMKKQALEAVGRADYNKNIPVELIMEKYLKAGATTVLAHPQGYFMEEKYKGFPREELNEFVEEMLELGLHGLEVYHKSNDEQVRDLLLKLADMHGLIVTGGSDAHSPDKIGQEEVPDRLIDAIY